LDPGRTPSPSIHTAFTGPAMTPESLF
jgi:hypothetical protein